MNLQEGLIQVQNSQNISNQHKSVVDQNHKHSSSPLKWTNKANSLISFTVKYKYFNAFVLIISALCNSMIGVSFATINHQVTSYYDVSTSLVSFCALQFLIINPIVAVFANYILDNKGLKLGVSISCVLNIVGVSFRLLISQSFYFVLVGNAFSALGNIFIVNCPSRFSSVWFKPTERIIITSLLSFSNAVSGQIGAILSPYFVANNLSPQEGRNSIENMLYFQGILISSVMIFNILFFRGTPDQPKNPLDKKIKDAIMISPTSSQQRINRSKPQSQISGSSSQQGSPLLENEKTDIIQKKNQQRYLNQLKTLFTTKTYIFTLISFSLVASVLNSFATNIQLYILPFGFTSNDAGDLTLVSVGTGLLGAILSGLIIKKLKRFKIVIVSQIFLSVIISLIFILSLVQKSKPMLYISVGLFTMLLYPLFPGMGEYCCEFMHPIRQSTVVGLLLGIGQLFSFGIVMIQTLILQQKTEKNAIIGWSINILCYILALLSILLTKQKLKRLFEQKLQQQN